MLPLPIFDFWDFSTNAVTPVSLGIPTIGFGPGDYKVAHMRKREHRGEANTRSVWFLCKLD